MKRFNFVLLIILFVACGYDSEIASTQTDVVIMKNRITEVETEIEEAHKKMVKSAFEVGYMTGQRDAVLKESWNYEAATDSFMFEIYGADR